MHVDSINITTGVINKHEFYKVEIHCPNLSPFHSIFMVRRSGIICGPIWGSFPVRGSFAVQVADHFRSGDHLRFKLGIISRPWTISYPESSGFLVSGATPGRLWGHRKNSIFLIGCSVTVSIVLPQKSCGNKIRCPQSLPGVAPLTKKPEDSGYEIGPWIICGSSCGSFPVRGSFAVQVADHFRSGDHLRFKLGIICGPVQCFFL